MQISSAGSYYGLTSPSPASNSNPACAAGSGTTGSNSAAVSQDNSVVQDFLNYAKESPAERLRDSILKSMGLTQDQLDKMPPAQRARSDAYFEGGYWLLLWDFLSTIIVVWLLLRRRRRPASAQ